ncbi:MAG: D-glycero-beta-D-manno-heptose-7-phosphate kinase [Acidobacteriaceae bacterium]|jgi:D-beta-D-heptose 7-phosphate kinase/D-beta-D-heptose 1-phosphate adenosyltransferase|nr:D-glycero-beta-D-manno-heptose-7-phosphate kinase [Acidobacteriaceae bacterium]
MTIPTLDPRRARSLVAAFNGVNVLVVGDVMLDRFIVGRVTRISPEAPVPVVRFESEYTRLGGAANVAHNLTALGARVSLVGVVGHDAAADRLRSHLADAHIDSSGLIAADGRPTVEKVRIVTERNQQVARIDYESDADVTADTNDALIDAIRRLATTASVLVVSDYLKGAITLPVMTTLVRAARTPHASGSARALIVDPKIPHLAYYAGATLITPNHHEAEIATHQRIQTDADARLAALEFRRRANCDAALITRGEHGMWLSAPSAEGAIPAVAREVSDVTGAGDTVVATLSLALAAGATLSEAAVLANHAAGVVVGKFGPATVSRTELITALDG